VSGTVIIGGGQAALSAAAELRKRKYDQPIIILAGEAAAPYQRPPLSKAYLAGELPVDRLWLKPAEWYDKAEIDLRTGVRVTALDRSACDVITDTGERIAYDQLDPGHGRRGATPAHSGRGPSRGACVAHAGGN
jgi:3-phenylpropionate/trans-cinnamate dioxygenase ferredoxin reductase subunit